jgi:hypothetical protein
MQTAAVQTVALVLASGTSDPAPEADDVTAGTWGLVVFLLLVAATVVLMLSFLKQMRKTEQARREGVFGDVPTEPAGDDADHADGRNAEGR